MATDEQPMALQRFLETRGSRKTGANSRTSTATKVDRGELASLRAAGTVGRRVLEQHGQYANDAQCAQAGR